MTIYAAGRGPKYEQILQWIGHSRTVLDVGCGAGVFSERIAQRNLVTGVELSEKNYQLAKARIPVIQGDFLLLDIGGHFDLVLLADVLEHLYEPEKALEKACSLGDEIILGVPNFDFIAARIMRTMGIKRTKTGILDETHVYFFNKQVVEAMLSRTPLKVLAYASPRPRRAPQWYQRLVDRWPSVFGIQFMYYCRVER